MMKRWMTALGAFAVLVSGCQSLPPLAGDTESDSSSQPATDSQAQSASQPDSETESQADSETETESETEAPLDPQCHGQPDYAPCSIATDPNRSFDLCLDGQCVSPGCGAMSCNLPGPAFLLPDTNQRTCYDESTSIPCPSVGEDFFGQDAHYGWDLTHTAAERFSRVTAPGSEIVVEDRVTGLTWQGCPAGASGADCGVGAPQDFTWDEALAYCETLDIAGISDWRLPGPHELLSLVDASTASSIDDAAFPGTAAAGYYWCSSTAPDTPLRAWYLSYGGAASMSYDYKTLAFKVRCVRGAPPSMKRFETLSESGDPIVRDHRTGLEWPACASCASTPRTWKQSLSHCELSSWAGRSDWRLPNAQELASLVDHRRASPACQTEVFPSLLPNKYWTSTSVAGTPSRAHVLSFAYGYSSDEAKTEELETLCVRDGDNP